MLFQGCLQVWSKLSHCWHLLTRVYFFMDLQKRHCGFKPPKHMTLIVVWKNFCNSCNTYLPSLGNCCRNTVFNRNYLYGNFMTHASPLTEFTSKLDIVHKPSLLYFLVFLFVQNPIPPPPRLGQLNKSKGLFICLPEQQPCIHRQLKQFHKFFYIKKEKDTQRRLILERSSAQSAHWRGLRCFTAEPTIMKRDEW